MNIIFLSLSSLLTQITLSDFIFILLFLTVLYKTIRPEKTPELTAATLLNTLAPAFKKIDGEFDKVHETLRVHTEQLNSHAALLRDHSVAISTLVTRFDKFEVYVKNEFTLIHVEITEIRTELTGIKTELKYHIRESDRRHDQSEARLTQLEYPEPPLKSKQG